MFFGQISSSQRVKKRSLILSKIAIDPEIKFLSQWLRRSQIEAVNKELEKMLEQDIIEEVTEAIKQVIVPKRRASNWEPVLAVEPTSSVPCFQNSQSIGFYACEDGKQLLYQ